MVTFAIKIVNWRVHFLWKKKKVQKVEDSHFKNQDVILK